MSVNVNAFLLFLCMCHFTSFFPFSLFPSNELIPLRKSSSRQLAHLPHSLRTSHRSPSLKRTNERHLWTCRSLFDVNARLSRFLSPLFWFVRSLCAAFVLCFHTARLAIPCNPNGVILHFWLPSSPPPPANPSVHRGLPSWSHDTHQVILKHIHTHILLFTVPHCSLHL